MNKSLEYEYKHNMQTDIPDLWARIDASLPEKVISFESKTDSLNANDIVKITDAKSKNKKKKNKAVYYISGVAAACLAGAVIIPGLLIGRRNEACATAECCATADEAYVDEAEYSDIRSANAASYDKEGESPVTDGAGNIALAPTLEENCDDIIQYDNNTDKYETNFSEEATAGEAEALYDNGTDSQNLGPASVPDDTFTMLHRINISISSYEEIDGKYLIEAVLLNDYKDEISAGTELQIDVTNIINDNNMTIDDFAETFKSQLVLDATSETDTAGSVILTATKLYND